MTNLLGGELESAPESVNDDPYGAGWLFQVDISKEEEIKKLLSPEQYATFLEEEVGDN